MGKVRRPRAKLHLASNKSIENAVSETLPTEVEPPQKPLMKIEGNLFEGLNINVDSLNKKLSDDVHSVKSLKSELGKNISKKDKLKLRREMFLKKFELLQQMKNEKKLQQKRKNTPIVGDMNPLHDALPSLESLLKTRTNIPYNTVQLKKIKGIEKASKQKKNQLQGIKTFQQVYKNKQFLKDPQLAISQHIKTVLEHEKSNL